jgi:hypothetical protein
MPKKQRPAMSVGLEMLLNNPATNPFTNSGSQGFKAVLAASELPITDALKHLGKKGASKKVPKLTDKEISEQRTSALEAETEE